MHDAYHVCLYNLKVFEATDEALLEEERAKERLCEELNMLVQQSAGAQLEKLEQVWRIHCSQLLSWHPCLALHLKLPHTLQTATLPLAALPHRKAAAFGFTVSSSIFQK